MNIKFELNEIFQNVSKFADMAGNHKQKKLHGVSYHINEIERFGEHIPLISEECEFDHFHEFEFINTKKTVNVIPHPLLIGLCSH